MPKLATNARALYVYELLEKFEGGLVLRGPEVKSAKAGSINLKGAFLNVQANGMVIDGMHIAPYAPAAEGKTYNPTRTRKVLVHRKELNKLRAKAQVERLTIVPISVYTKGDLVKLEFALARGKRQFEKRASVKKREVEREVRQRLKE